MLANQSKKIIGYKLNDVSEVEFLNSLGIDMKDLCVQKKYPEKARLQFAYQDFLQELKVGDVVSSEFKYAEKDCSFQYILENFCSQEKTPLLMQIIQNIQQAEKIEPTYQLTKNDIDFLAKFVHDLSDDITSKSSKNGVKIAPPTIKYLVNLKEGQDIKSEWQEDLTKYRLTRVIDMMNSDQIKKYGEEFFEFVKKVRCFERNEEYVQSNSPKHLHEVKLALNHQLHKERLVEKSLH